MFTAKNSHVSSSRVAACSRWEELHTDVQQALGVQPSCTARARSGLKWGKVIKMSIAPFTCNHSKKEGATAFTFLL